eukprot:scaffold11520_cov106-Amphora_coffeaeformis.AAC.5
MMFNVFVVSGAAATNEAADEPSSNPLILLPPASSSSSEAQHHHRSLQALQEGDTVETSILSNSCVYEDSFTDPRLKCDVTTRFVNPSSAAAQVVAVTLDCASSLSTSTFRQVADACVCNAMVTSDPSITCSCAACPQDVGANWIFVDCQDELLIDTCSSVDCEYTCNGPSVTDILTSPPTLSPSQGGGGTNNDNTNPTPTPNIDSTTTSPPSVAAPRLDGRECLFLVSFGLGFSTVLI